MHVWCPRRARYHVRYVGMRNCVDRLRAQLFDGTTESELVSVALTKESDGVCVALAADEEEGYVLKITLDEARDILRRIGDGTHLTFHCVECAFTVTHAPPDPSWMVGDDLPHTSPRVSVDVLNVLVMMRELS